MSNHNEVRFLNKESLVWLSSLWFCSFSIASSPSTPPQYREAVERLVRREAKANHALFTDIFENTNTRIGRSFPEIKWKTNKLYNVSTRGMKTVLFFSGTCAQLCKEFSDFSYPLMKKENFQFIHIMTTPGKSYELAKIHMIDYSEGNRRMLKSIGIYDTPLILFLDQKGGIIYKQDSDNFNPKIIKSLLPDFASSGKVNNVVRKPDVGEKANFYHLGESGRRIDDQLSKSNASLVVLSDKNCDACKDLEKKFNGLFDSLAKSNINIIYISNYYPKKLPKGVIHQFDPSNKLYLVLGYVNRPAFMIFSKQKYVGRVPYSAMITTYGEVITRHVDLSVKMAVDYALRLVSQRQ